MNERGLKTTFFVLLGVAGFAYVGWLLFPYHRVDTRDIYQPLGGHGAGPIRAIQLDLKKIGIPVATTGSLDDATVQAINQIFNGSVDVPPRLATGNLSKRDIVANILAVSRALKIIVRGAQNFEDVSHG